MFIIGSRRMGRADVPFQVGGGTTQHTDAETTIAEANRLANSYAGTYEFVVLECAAIHTISVEKPVKVKKDVIVYD